MDMLWLKSSRFIRHVFFALESDIYEEFTEGNHVNSMKELKCLYGTIFIVIFVAFWLKSR